MAKKSNKESSGKSRFRVFFAEFEGSDDTIKESLAAINTAVSKTFEPKTTIKYIYGENLPSENENEIDEILNEDVEDEDMILETKIKRNGTPSKPPKLTLVKSLNLMPEGKESLKDFYATKNPQTQYEKITVVIFYMQKVLEIDDISSDHVYTCFKEVSEKIPRNLPQSIRNTAKDKAWVDSSNKNKLTVTIHGENLVEHELEKNTQDD